MRTLEEIQKQYDKFVCAAISAEYNSDWEEPPDLEPYIQDLIEMRSQRLTCYEAVICQVYSQSDNIFSQMSFPAMMLQEIILYCMVFYPILLLNFHEF